MANTIAFTLRNNQMTDVNVTVVDLRTGASTVENAPLNVGESIAVTVVAGSDGTGSAAWAFASGNGSVNSNKTQTNIRDGDDCTLG
jgi:hypothetical protein